MKKLVVVCTTKINDESNKNFIGMLSESLDPELYSVAVFHSVFDFARRNMEVGARLIYRMLPFDRLCAVIILRDSLFDRTIIDDIIDDATEHYIPVIMARGSDNRCFSVAADFREAYKELLNSVIKGREFKNAYYVAGRKQDDPDGEHRLAVYEEVLRENGLEPDPKKIAYGAYWENPTIAELKKIFDRGERPDAFFCANDIMAFTVMDVLRERGVKVPEDVVVTGFDGLESSKYCAPSLSTCCEDTAELVRLTAETIKKLSASEAVPAVQYYPYRAAIRQSSVKDHAVKVEELDNNLFFRMRADEINEREYNRWLDGVISVPNVENLRSSVPVMVNDGVSVCIRADAFLSDDSKVSPGDPGEYIMMTRNADGEIDEKFVYANKVINKFIDSTPEDSIGYYSMISKGDFVYGLAFTPCRDIPNESQKINRYVNTFNRALFVALSGEKQRKNVGEHYKRKYTDALTGMLNIDGANKWFVDAVLNEYTHINQLTVGVYTFINYQQTLENFGTHTLEGNMQYIAKALKLANPEYAVIARISVDSFAVLLPHPKNDAYASVIDNSISLFYGYLDTQRKIEVGAADIEISCGYTDSQTPWLGKLSDLLNAATSNLYRNRMSFEKHLPKDVDMADSAGMMEYRATFMTLINENLLIYHFQPIADARTGEIVAYEALMRTTGGINMSPLDVLAAATMFSKLEQVEFMSFTNIYERLSRDRERFGQKRVFINTIPGHFVRPELCEEINSRYSDLLAQSVIEITESETITLSELEAIRSFGGTRSGVPIAVDDYGTGHSNIVNLIEYQPQIVKIDRYLITNIRNDKNKQMFVKSLIEFSAENNIKVLAEGVETREEMETVIDFGVDFIQGYYTARPDAELLTELPSDIKAQIVHRANDQY